MVGFLGAIGSDRSDSDHLHGHMVPGNVGMELVTHSGLVGASSVDLPLIPVLKAYPRMSILMDLD